MAKFSKSIAYPNRRQAGAAIPEYLLLIAMCFVVILTSTKFLEQGTQRAFNRLNNSLRLASLDAGGTRTNTRGGFEGPGDDFGNGDDDDPPPGDGRK